MRLMYQSKCKDKVLSHLCLFNDTYPELKIVSAEEVLSKYLFIEKLRSWMHGQTVNTK